MGKRRRSRLGIVFIRLQGAVKWRQDSRWILNSRTRLDGWPVFKFCYQPATGRLWLGHGTQNHKAILNVKSGLTLEHVVRGIYFRERRLIYLRGHEREDWLEQTAAMLRAQGIPEHHRVIWGVAAAKRFRVFLHGL